MNKLGFGFMRIPLKEGNNEADEEQVNRLVDLFLGSGHNYFDTAYTYGKNEEFLRKALVERYPREKYQLADKLPGYLCKSYEDCQKYFDEQLERCGVSYFDVFLLHWLTAEHYVIAEQCEEFRFLKELKQKGLAKQIGFSYHDSAEVLDKILSEHPEVDVVQLQINYLDWESAGIQAKACYDVCVKHEKRIIVMEPVKGGTLSKVPSQVQEMFAGLHPDWSPSAWALRFVSSLPQVDIVLSGMSRLEQMRENLQEHEALGQQELDLLRQAVKIINQQTAIPCTGCGYCTDFCSKDIRIPDYFRLFNENSRYPEDSWKIIPVYKKISGEHGHASDCVSCGLCAQHCPQQINIPGFMKLVAENFDK